MLKPLMKTAARSSCGWRASLRGAFSTRSTTLTASYSSTGSTWQRFIGIGPLRQKRLSRLRIAYFGTSSFAVPALEALASKVELVVTQPSRPSGRGNRLVPTPVGLVGRALGIEVLSPERARDPDFIGMIESRRF